MGFRLLGVQLFEHLMLFIICFVQAFELFVFCHVTPYVVVGRAVVQVMGGPACLGWAQIRRNPHRGLHRLYTKCAGIYVARQPIHSYGNTRHGSPRDARTYTVDRMHNLLALRTFLLS